MGLDYLVHVPPVGMSDITSFTTPGRKLSSFIFGTSSVHSHCESQGKDSRLSKSTLNLSTGKPCLLFVLNLIYLCVL